MKNRIFREKRLVFFDVMGKMGEYAKGAMDAAKNVMAAGNTPEGLKKMTQMMKEEFEKRAEEIKQENLKKCKELGQDVSDALLGSIDTKGKEYDQLMTDLTEYNAEDDKDGKKLQALKQRLANLNVEKAIESLKVDSHIDYASGEFEKKMDPKKMAKMEPFLQERVRKMGAEKFTKGLIAEGSSDGQPFGANVDNESGRFTHAKYQAILKTVMEFYDKDKLDPNSDAEKIIDDHGDAIRAYISGGKAAYMKGDKKLFKGKIFNLGLAALRASNSMKEATGKDLNVDMHTLRVKTNAGRGGGVKQEERYSEVDPTLVCVEEVKDNGEEEGKQREEAPVENFDQLDPRYSSIPDAPMSMPDEKVEGEDDSINYTPEHDLPGLQSVEPPTLQDRIVEGADDLRKEAEKLKETLKRAHENYERMRRWVEEMKKELQRTFDSLSADKKAEEGFQKSFEALQGKVKILDSELKAMSKQIEALSAVELDASAAKDLADLHTRFEFKVAEYDAANTEAIDWLKGKSGSLEVKPLRPPEPVSAMGTIVNALTKGVDGGSEAADKYQEKQKFLAEKAKMQNLLGEAMQAHLDFQGKLGNPSHGLVFFEEKDVSDLGDEITEEEKERIARIEGRIWDMEEKLPYIEDGESKVGLTLSGIKSELDADKYEDLDEVRGLNADLRSVISLNKAMLDLLYEREQILNAVDDRIIEKKEAAKRASGMGAKDAGAPDSGTE